MNASSISDPVAIRTMAVRRGAALLFVCTLLGLVSCGEPSSASSNEDGEALEQSLIDDAVPQETRLARILELATVQKPKRTRSLIRAMKHRSQCAFLLVDDPGRPLGFAVVEMPTYQVDEKAMDRVAAIVTLERLGTAVPLVDLALALDDVSPAVRAHAARALLRLGCRAGLPVLRELLDGRVLAREVANAILEEVTETSVGFRADASFAARQRAIAKWEGVLAKATAGGGRFPIEGRGLDPGLDGEADRRIRFTVDMLGQMQFLFHEQARTAMQRLGTISLPYLREAVEKDRQAGHPNPTLRAGVAQVLARIHAPQARELLDALLSDPHPSVRSRAAVALGEHPLEEALPLLERALKDSDRSVVRAAARALGQLGGEAAVALLTRLAPDDEALARSFALARFHASQGRSDRQAVLDLLVEGSVGERNAVFQVLRDLGHGAVPYDALADTEERTAARDAFERLLQ